MTTKDNTKHATIQAIKTDIPVTTDFSPIAYPRSMTSLIEIDGSVMGIKNEKYLKI